MFTRIPSQLSLKDLESWLDATLLPVEPSERFLGNLRARLIRYHGGRPMSGWMLIAIFASVLLLGLTIMGLFIRILLAIAAVLQSKNRQRRVKKAIAL